MASNTLSDPFVAAAFWTGAGALLLTLALSLQIVHLRVRLRRAERLDAHTVAKWRPQLHAALFGDVPAALPPLAARERLPFLKLWVHLQASLRGDAGDGLNEVARRLALDLHARTMLSRGKRAERLLAMLVLGYLRDRQAWQPLLRHAGEEPGALSLTALWALVRIDPPAAAQYMVPRFVERDGWALSHVAGILQQAPDAVAAVLGQILPQLDGERLPRALRIAEALRVELPPGVLAQALCSTSTPVLVAALRSVFTPDAISEVRALLGHRDWQVRVQAAKALGRIGGAGDADRLAGLLGDREWWVRYRAAQALADLPSGPDLDALQSSLTDRFAADMLAQVRAERSLA